MTEERDFEMGQHAMRWYGWGSPIGLGSFAVLLSTAFELVRTTDDPLSCNSRGRR